MDLALTLLGETEFNLNGKPIKNLNAIKAYALLIYLVVDPDHAHRRDALAEMFWPEKPEGYGRNNLKQTLSQLRTALGDREAPEPFIISSKRDLQFNSNSKFQVDLLDFEAQISKVQKHCQATENTCENCAALLDQAAALYRDDFLVDFYLSDSPEFYEWVLTRRESCKRLMADILGRLIHCSQEENDYKNGILFAKKLIDLEPWSESNHRRLMALLAASGKRSAALKQYHLCETMLATEFGIQPTPETMRLFETIKKWDQRGGINGPFYPPPDSGRESDFTELPRSPAIRNWIKISASLSFLILGGMIYILFGVLRPENRSQAQQTLDPDSPSAANSDTIPIEEVTSGQYTSENVSSSTSLNPDPTSPAGSTAQVVGSSKNGDPSSLSPKSACLPGEQLLYLEDFQENQIQEWPELHYLAQGWKIIPDPFSPDNLVVYHTGDQDAGTDLQNIIFENSVYRIWIMKSGTGTAFLRWNLSSPPQSNDTDILSYQMEIHYQDNSQAGHAMYRVEWPVNHVTVASKLIEIPENTWVLYEIFQYQGQTLIRVDNTEIISYRDPYPLPIGKVGFEVWSTTDETFEIYFDNLSICALTAPYPSPE